MAMLQAARRGIRVMAQIDTAFRGPQVLRVLQNWGVEVDHLTGSIWIVSLQRISTLCDCKRQATPDAALLQALHSRYPHLEIDPCASFYQVGGCQQCEHTGRRNEVTAFDFYHAGSESIPCQTSLLPLETYLLGLAETGYISLDDLLNIDRDHLEHIYQLLVHSERTLVETRSSLERKIVELEAANRVLRNRTQELVSLQEIGQALIGTSTLRDLARQVCRQASTLCGADRAVFYFMRDEERAEVLATHGWPPGRVPPRVSAGKVCSSDCEPLPARFDGWPPGVKPRHPDVEGEKLLAGLRVPLIAQGKPVGAMIVHTTKMPRFQPGSVALLQTFANQAAIAIQRAGLIESLQENIAQLEAAQIGLAQKERLERELELAREVQQSVLPHTFPQIPGYRFAARNLPARQVGGDFYDVIDLGNHRFGVVIADVSDKGMPAAFYMALTRSLMLAEARRNTSPMAVLRNVNGLLRELGRAKMFVTVFYGIIDGPARQLIYTRAGHDRPLLLRQGEVIELSGDGVFLGYLDTQDLFLTEETLALQPGDRLALFTDGLTDTISPQGRRFDLPSLRSLLATGHHLAAADLCNLVFETLAAYQADAEQYDDMTLLVVEVERLDCGPGVHNQKNLEP
jgi:sigma-B regulation protein RsbU (phosphoserine phosphatase)